MILCRAPDGPRLVKVYQEWESMARTQRIRNGHVPIQRRHSEIQQSLIRVIAPALNLEESFFGPYGTFPNWRSSHTALHYPSQEVSNGIGIGAHADYSNFLAVTFEIDFG